MFQKVGRFDTKESNKGEAISFLLENQGSRNKPDTFFSLNYDQYDSTAANIFELFEMSFLFSYITSCLKMFFLNQWRLPWIHDLKEKMKKTRVS